MAQQTSSCPPARSYLSRPTCMHATKSSKVTVPDMGEHLSCLIFLTSLYCRKLKRNSRLKWCKTQDGVYKNWVKNNRQDFEILKKNQLYCDNFPFLPHYAMSVVKSFSKNSFFEVVCECVMSKLEFTIFCYTLKLSHDE